MPHRIIALRTSTNTCSRALEANGQSSVLSKYLCASCLIRDHQARSPPPACLCMYRSIRKKDDETEGVNEIHEFWDGKITSAMEAEWRSLGYRMFQSFPPVKSMHIHCGQEQPAGEDDEEFDGCSEFTKYLHRPTELDALLAPSVGQDMPTALDYFERVTVVTVPPASVRAA